eukprot:461177-Ditylum_brightwellii.AAC.1
MLGDVSMVETHVPIAVMRFPETAFPAVRIYHSIGGNTTMAFVQEDVTLQIHSTTSEEKTFLGGELDIKIEYFSSTTFTSYYLTEQLPSSNMSTQMAHRQ